MEFLRKVLTVTDLSSKSCLNCGATEADRPMMMWHYQERELWICAECLPLMIHKREQLMIKWPPPETSEPPQAQ